MTTTTEIARRNGGAPAAPSAALAIRSGQAMWDDKQRAALVAMGVSPKATTAELAVFFHQCQKLRLDPFTKQIYLIHRRAKEGDKWVDKPTTQIGIDGFRVTRDRIAGERGVTVEYEETVWYDAQGQGYEVWLWDEPPTACKFVVRVDGRRFPSVLRFNEYCQRDREGNRTGKWRDSHAHQIEKCCEADALRRAFPNDLSGVILEDMAPLDDPDAPPAQPQRRGVTAEQIRQRQTVTATVVTKDPSPADGGSPSAAPAAPAQAAGEAPPAGGERPPALIASGQKSRLDKERQRLGYGDSEQDWDDWLAGLAGLAGLTAIATPGELTQDEAAGILTRLKALPDRQALRRLLETGEAAQDTGGQAGDGE